jgi:signal transduction histidine kinase
VILVVRDRGVGMSTAELDRVFEPFRSTFAGGTGLGLSIVHRIVCDAGGSIAVESAPGSGTAVRIALPGAPVVTAGDQPVRLSA